MKYFLNFYFTDADFSGFFDLCQAYAVRAVRTESLSMKFLVPFPITLIILSTSNCPYLNNILVDDPVVLLLVSAVR